MPSMRASERARLPDRAFAYIDSRGRRRLPIHDAPHVRAALARFDQVAFEDQASVDRARARLLGAAKRHGIMPIGFIERQLRSAGPWTARHLPRGTVTFLLSDIEASTELLERIGDGYAAILAEVRRLHRDAVGAAGGHEVDARADEYLAVFQRPAAALAAAVAIQRAIAAHAWPDGAAVRVRMGVHSGRPTLTREGYVGIAVHVAARVSAAANGGQVLVTEDAVRALDGSEASAAVLHDLGPFRLRGLRTLVTLHRVELGPDADARPPRASATTPADP
jgi:class 3 adenylate cyclase